MSNEIELSADVSRAMMALMDIPLDKIIINPEAMTRHTIDSMGLDYDLLTCAVWDHIMPKLFKLYYNVSQGEKITKNDVNKLIRRELKKLMKPKSKGGRDG